MQAHDSIRPRGLLRLLDDWWNPILVKEVRQALRGKFFRVAFALVISAVVITMTANIVSMGAVVSPGEGRAYFLSIFTCLSIAVLGVVPFSAFNAMGAEWDENTYDLLVISNLRPRQILIGKMLSVGVQTLLFYAAFTPFLVFAFLLRGVDLTAAFVILAGAFLCSLGVALVALMLSTVTRVKFVRVALMALLAGALTGGVTASVATAEQLLRYPQELASREAAMGMVAFVATVAMIALFCLAVGSNMLAHAEENRSTGVRALISSTLLVASGLIGWALYEFPDKEAVSVMCVILMCWLVPACIFFVTEPERLGRRVAPRVPRNPVLALLATPWLPGGGRGFLFLLLHLALLLFLAAIGHAALTTSGDPFMKDGPAALVIGTLYIIVYLGLPSGFLSSFTDRPQLRLAVRALVPLSIALFAFAPAVVGFFIGDPNLMGMEHGGHPFFVGDKVWSQGRLYYPNIWIMITALALLSLLLNLPRVQRGIMEVLAASGARRRAESAAAQATLLPVEEHDAVA